jgi:MBG domain-containing protein
VPEFLLLANYSTSATTGSPIGTYAITAALNDPTNKSGNYTVTLNSGTLTVNPAPLMVTPANANRLYGSANPAFTGAIVGLKNSDAITASYGTTATQSSNVGSYDITATLSDPANKLSNYTVTLNKGTLTINPAPLTIKADNKTKFLNASNPPLTATYS